MRATNQKGFSLIELMITIAIIGIVAAIAMPAYREYIDTANMTKVNAAYENAVRLAQQEFVKNNTRIAMGFSATLPQTNQDWAELFNPGNQVQAPGGGPAYDTSNRRRSNADQTGAIRISWNKRRGRLDIFRPAYLDLKARRARVDSDGVTFR